MIPIYGHKPCCRVDPGKVTDAILEGWCLVFVAVRGEAMYGLVPPVGGVGAKLAAGPPSERCVTKAPPHGRSVDGHGTIADPAAGRKARSEKRTSMRTVESRLAALEQNQASLLAENDALRAENLELRSVPHPAGTHAPHDTPPSEVERRTVSRRGMIAAVAGAAGGLLLTNATPAAAATGNDVLLGQINESGVQTTIIHTGSGSAFCAESQNTEGVTKGVFGQAVSPDGIGVSGLASCEWGPTKGVHGESSGFGGVGVSGLASAVWGGTKGVYGEVASTDGVGVKGYAPASSGFTRGVTGVAASTDAYGVFGHATATTGAANGVYGLAVSGDGVGVSGVASAEVGANKGVYGEADGNEGVGVKGYAPSISGDTRGVVGLAASTSGYGVSGLASAVSGTTNGVRGQADSPTGFGVFGANAATRGAAGMALYGQGRLKVTGRSYFGTPNSVPLSADLNKGSISFYLDQAANNLKVRVKYSTGVLKTATIALT